jgi:hypothetical protein
MKRTVIAVLLATLIVFGSLTPVSSSTFLARVESDRVHVRVLSNLTQNITTLFEKKISISGDALSNAARIIERQIRAKSPDGSVRGISIQSMFANNSVEVTLDFDVLSVVSKREEVVIANLTWRAFDIVDDLEAETVHYNLVGKTYFRSAIPQYENMTGMRFYENRTLPATLYRARDIAGNVTMLRLSPLRAPLSRWNMTYDVVRTETRYTFKCGRIVDLAVRRELNSSAASFGIWMDLTGEVSIPGYAKVRGEGIVSEVQIGIFQILMFFAVAIPVLGVIATHLIERKRTGTGHEGRRR